MDGLEERSSRPLIQNSPCSLLILPIELLVHIISFLTSARDKVILRYVSQQMRAVVETPSLWRDLTWPHFNVREQSSVQNVLKLCGGHIKRLSFPNLVMPIQFLKHCRNVVQLSFPSANLSLEQIRSIIEPAKKLQHLDILWAAANIKPLLLITTNLKELTIRDAEFLTTWLYDWSVLNFIPHMLNVVTRNRIPVTCVVEYLASNLYLNSPTFPTAHLKFYNRYEVMIGLSPTLPEFQFQFGQFCTPPPFVNASKYGLLGLDKNVLLLTSRVIDGGDTLCKAVMMRNNAGSYIDGCHMNSKITSLNFVTHFDASASNDVYSGHLEQLALICPNLQQLNLEGNVNCLKNLQGLRVLASICQKLQGLNILGISVKKVENTLQLWEILVDLKLIYLGIELCCLVCYDRNDQTKQTIISLHQKCIKLKALESQWNSCTKCVNTTQPLLLSNFPSLIHCLINDINIKGCGKLRFLRYAGDYITCSWSVTTICLEQLCIMSDQVELCDSFMNALSIHGGLVHVVLSVNSVTQDGITALIENSPNLIVCQIHIRTLAVWRILFNVRRLRSSLQKKYATRKLFLCGSFHLVQRSLNDYELHDLIEDHNMDLKSFWSM